MSGKGVYTYRDGTTYDGTFANGKMEGSGIMTYVSGNRYEGSFSNNMKSGQGTYFFNKKKTNRKGYVPVS